MDQITQPTAEQRENARDFWGQIVNNAPDLFPGGVPEGDLGLAACGVIATQLTPVVVDEIEDWLAIMATMAWTTGDAAAIAAANRYALWHVETMLGFLECGIASGLVPDAATWEDTIAYCEAQAAVVEDADRALSLRARLDQVRAAMRDGRLHSESV